MVSIPPSRDVSLRSARRARVPRALAPGPRFTPVLFQLLVLALLLFGCDTEPGDDDLPDAHAPEFIVGHGPIDSLDPTTFVGLSEGAVLPVGRGAQGSYMCVIGFKTRGQLARTVSIEADLVGTGGETLAFRGSTNQRLDSEADGFDYLMNFWLVSSFFEDSFDGNAATLTITVTDSRGEVASSTVNVVLRATNFF